MFVASFVGMIAPPLWKLWYDFAATFFEDIYDLIYSAGQYIKNESDSDSDNPYAEDEKGQKTLDKELSYLLQSVNMPLKEEIKENESREIKVAYYEPVGYLYDKTVADPVVLARYSSPNTLKATESFSYGVLGRTSSDTSGVYVYDGRGSVVETVVGGKISSVLHYDPFGNITKGAPEQEQIFGYNGEQYTPQSGFIYLRARNYDPESATFISKDTYAGNKREPVTRNRYAYGNNNPLAYGAYKASKEVKSGAASKEDYNRLAFQYGTENMFAISAISSVTVGGTAMAYKAMAAKLTTAMATKATAVTTAASQVNEMAGQASDVAKTVCFTAGTLILTSTGLKNIETIQANDYVYAKEAIGIEQTVDIEAESSLERVIQVFVNETYETYKITIDGEKIETTSEHPFYTEDGTPKAARDLKEGDKLATAGGETATVEETYVIYHKEPIKVYNFEVENAHTYFVGKVGVLVHNACEGVKNTIVEKTSSSVANGVNSYNPLENIEYTNKVLEQMQMGDYHSLPESVRAFGDLGQIKTVIGGDGVARNFVEIIGGYKDKEGIFQFIIEADGFTVNHRLFVPLK